MKVYSVGGFWCAKCQRRVSEEETYVAESPKRRARHHNLCGCTVRLRGRSKARRVSKSVRKNVIGEGVDF